MDKPDYKMTAEDFHLKFLLGGDGHAPLDIPLKIIDRLLKVGRMTPCPGCGGNWGAVLDLAVADAHQRGLAEASTVLCPECEGNHSPEGYMTCSTCEGEGCISTRNGERIRVVAALEKLRNQYSAYSFDPATSAMNQALTDVITAVEDMTDPEGE